MQELDSKQKELLALQWLYSSEDTFKSQVAQLVSVADIDQLLRNMNARTRELQDSIQKLMQCNMEYSALENSLKVHCTPQNREHFEEAVQLRVEIYGRYL